MLPTKKQLEEADRILREFDWAKYDAMSDEEIRAHWAWDEDMTWPTEAELAEFKLVPATKAPSGKPASANTPRKPPEAAE